jgi:argininosuccinate lyase
MLMTLTVNKEQMKKATENGYLIALDLAEKLVQKGIPFRTSHKIIGQLVQNASSSKKPLSKLTSFDVKNAIKGTNVDSKFLIEIIRSTTINSSLQNRISQGSSGFSEQKRMIENRMKKINAYREGVTKRDKHVKIALENLSKKVKELIK